MRLRLSLIHRGIVINEVLALGLGELEHFRHDDTLRRARPDAERAIAALRHVDVELRHPERLLLRVLRRDAEVFTRDGLHGVNRDTIDRACAGALVAPDAVVHVDI